MVRETIRFKCRSDAMLFDKHLRGFLSYCETRPDRELSCLFSAHDQDDSHYIRVIQTDNTRMLGKLLNYLKIRKFKLPASQFGGQADG